MGTFIYVVIAIILAIWVYKDAKINMRRGTLWALGVLFMPILFPAYFWSEPPYLFWDCPNCRRRNLPRRHQCPKCNTVFTEADVKRRLYGYWNISDAVSILIISEFITTFLWLLYAISAGATEGIPLDELVSANSSIQWLIGLVSGNLLIGVCFYCVTGRYRLPLKALGLHKKTRLRYLGIAILLALLLVLAGDIILGIITSTAKLAGNANIESLIQQEMQKQHRYLPHEPSDPVLLLAGFVLIILVPVSEEIFFRGVTYIALKDKFGKIKGMFFSALFFAVRHGFIFYFLPLFLIGFSLAYLYERTRSMIPCIVAHSLINLVALVSLIYG